MMMMNPLVFTRGFCLSVQENPEYQGKLSQTLSLSLIMLCSSFFFTD